MSNAGALRVLEKLVGSRFKSVEQISDMIEKYTGYECVVFESESDMIYGTTDYTLDYYFKDDENEIFTIWYLKDRAGNYYITEV